MDSEGVGFLAIDSLLIPLSSSLSFRTSIDLTQREGSESATTHYPKQHNVLLINATNCSKLIHHARHYIYTFAVDDSSYNGISRKVVEQC